MIIEYTTKVVKFSEKLGMDTVYERKEIEIPDSIIEEIAKKLKGE